MTLCGPAFRRNFAEKVAPFYDRFLKTEGREKISPGLPFFIGVTGNPSFLSVGVRRAKFGFRALSDPENRALGLSFPFSGGGTRLADEKNDFHVISVTPKTIAPQYRR